MRVISTVFFFAAGLLACGPAGAVTFQDFSRSVSLQFFDDTGMLVTSDGDNESLPASGVFQNPLSAFIGGAGFQADVDMQTSGFFGVTGQQTIPGSLQANIGITILVTNDQANPINVPFNFIINEGLFVINAGQGSTLSYDLNVNTVGFVSEGDLVVGPGGVSFLASGDDIGASHNGFGRVDVPFSFQGISETLDPGDSRFFSYDLSIVSDVQVFSEITLFEFRDPADFGNLPPGATQFGPGAVVTAVDAPGTLALLGGGLILLAAVRRRVLSG